MTRARVLTRRQLPGPGDPKVLDTESGRGLVLMASFTDELIFNDVGNEVTMVKRCRHFG